MIALDRLLPFLLAVALIELTPGPNMGYLALVAGRSGRAAGMTVVAGVTLGLVVYLVASVFGLSEAAARWPWLFHGLRWAGIIYLGLLALEAWFGQTSAAPTPGMARGLFLRGFLNNLLNPKAAVFYVVLLPGFVSAERGHMIAQSLILGAIHIGVSVAVHSAIAWTAGGARPSLEALNGKLVQRLFALGLVSIAVWLALSTSG